MDETGGNFESHGNVMNHVHESNSNSDFSILTAPPSGTNMNNGLLDLSGVNLTLYNSLQSYTSDLSLDEAVNRVQALMKENQDLKGQSDM